MFNISFGCCRHNVSNTFVQLTEGRSARDQPKQPPAKKNEKLEKNVVLLEECRADSSSIQSLTAEVNYYASTTKASQAAATAQHKQMAWDWLSDPREKQPLKETLKSVRYQCECTSKAAYQVVEVSKEILEELKSDKETMTEQTRLMKLFAGNKSNCQS